jgi:hypothetical protein
MLENAIPSATSEPSSPGARLRLVSLAPKFDEQQHQTYFDLLTRALDHDGVTNVALTGAYGTGKSSVLEKLRTEVGYENRLVRLSLSTIAPKASTSDPPEQNAAEATATSRVNQIQKEIVKQLLYTTKPEEVPQSRYRRTSVPDHRWNLWIALGTGLGLWLILFLLGPFHALITNSFDGFWRHLLAYAASAALLVACAWVVVGIIRSRPAVSASVNAAVTTITLSKQADTYFDDYLDEIVYVFQVTQRDIVVIEDIDRFQDVEIFDALRALNSLLNSSRQITKRIVFVYAIRDSVFERIGSDVNQDEIDHPEKTGDHAKQSLKLASRTKFFDVIIPVVPFVSADNARDLMSDAMRSDQFKIAPALIRLAARHVADMRLIHNIRNEFEVYRNQLVVPENRIPGISDDLVFAIVLYKNTHLNDFELLRNKDSSLDRLYRAWRMLVTTNLKESALPAVTAFRAYEQLESRRQARAALLSRRMNAFRDDLHAATPTTVTVSLPPDLPALEAPETWVQIVAQDGLELTLTNRAGTKTPMTFTAAMLSRLLGASIDPDEWESLDRERAEGELATLEGAVYFLRHHSWEQLCERTDLTVATSALDLTVEEMKRLNAEADNGTDRVSFSTLVNVLLTSELARDLVRHGYLTSHFASYASSYYGKHLGPRAREYIYRFVDPGEADATFSLGRKDVRQLLREQDAEIDDNADIFRDPSILNLNIIDFLLKERLGAAATVTKQLARDGIRRDEFLNLYMAQGRRPAALLALLAKSWPRVLLYAATSDAIPETDRIANLNAVLTALPHSDFDVNNDVAQLLASHYREMNAVISPSSQERASIVLGVLRASGAAVDELSPLNSEARTLAVDLKLFPITEANLRVISPSGKIGLDTLIGHRAAYEHTHAHLRAFVTLVEKHPGTLQTVIDPGQFETVLKDVRSTDAELITRLLAGAPPEASVVSLRSVPKNIWSALASSRRVPATFSNVEAYISELGVDSHLRTLLSDRRVLDAEEGDLEARREMAYVILKSREAIPSTLARVKIASSLAPGVLDPERITPESGDLPARLLMAKLLDDAVEVFASPLMLDWPTMEKSIKASRTFATFVTPAVLPVAWVADYMRSALVSIEEKRAVVTTLQSFLTTGTPANAGSIAAALISRGWKILPSRMLELRAAGASPTQIIHLLRAQGEELALDQITHILSSLGGSYARVASGGRGRPNFPNDAAHLAVLSRFIGRTLRDLETQTLKSRGTRLVAHLKH